MHLILLVHLIDHSQNTNFRDKYFHGLKFDLSKVTFMFSYNNPSKVDPILRDRIKALTQIQSSQKINQTNLKEADVISIFKESGKTCVQVFFFRSKQNWGNQAYFPKHDPDEKIEKILSSFIGQFYENKSVPRMILLNTDVEDRLLLETTFSKREKKEITVKLAKTHDEKILSKLAEKNAKESLTQKILETESNSKLIDNISDKFSGLALIGISSIFISHLFVNCAMVSGMIPVKGLPLPFISYGGSFLISCFLMVGLILNFGREQ